MNPVVLTSDPRLLTNWDFDLGSKQMKGVWKGVFWCHLAAR